MIYYYRSDVSDERCWWPHPPRSKPIGRVWTDDMLLDWSTGNVISAQPVLDHNKQSPRGQKIAIDGLRVRTLKSSDERKYHVGGPYNGAKLRKWIKRKNRKPVEILLDRYEIPGIIGHYQFDQGKDQYIWTER